MRVGIIGASGYMGEEAARALALLPNLEVVPLNRKGDLPRGRAFDLSDPLTYPAADDLDLLVNASDAARVSPIPFYEHALARGKLLLETTADRGAMAALIDRFRGQPSAGCLVLGVGIFPGLSNLVGAAAAAKARPCKRLEVGLRFGPFSRGGQGMVDLAATMFRHDSVQVQDHELAPGSPIQDGPVLPFMSANWSTVIVPFCEPELLHLNRRAPSIVLAVAPAPWILRPMFLMLPLALARAKAFQALMQAYFALLRRVLFRWRRSPVEIVAVAHNAHAQRRLALKTPDGMRLGGDAIAAVVQALQERPHRPTGAVPVDKLFDLDDILARCRALGATEFEVQDTEATLEPKPLKKRR
jgi:NAD(P)-dependent dehydrogenase (short-subunit alcohol dehydrogenase family)